MLVSKIVNNLRFVNRDFQQRRIEDLLALIDQALRDLLAHTGTLKCQVLGLSTASPQA